LNVPAESGRLQSIAVAVVDALQEVVDKHEITQDELHATGNFLDRIGRAGMGKSLLDIFFAMTVVDRERQGRVGTRPNLAGPYYRAGAPERQDGSLLERAPGPDSSLLTLTGAVTDARTGAPIGGAELDLWHADEHGGYDHDGFHLRGVVRTDDDGRYVVHTLLPTDYAEHKNDPIGELLIMIGRHTYRAAHIHLKVRVDGEEWLMTQLFRSDSPYLDSDYVRGAVASDLVLDLKEVDGIDGHAAYESVFDLSIAPPDERIS
jgi:catechol 1,2-dioxygenase